MDRNDAFREPWNRIEKYVTEGRLDQAAAEAEQAIEAATAGGREDDACYLYARLAGVFFVSGDTERAMTTLRACEARFPNSVLAKFLTCEKLFWYARDYSAVVASAEAVARATPSRSGYYHQAIYLKGLAHLELGNPEEAAAVLRETEYYDLALVEGLLRKGLEKSECRAFLDRAERRFVGLEARGEDVQEQLAKTRALRTMLH